GPRRRARVRAPASRSPAVAGGLRRGSPRWQDRGDPQTPSRARRRHLHRGLARPGVVRRRCAFLGVRGSPAHAALLGAARGPPAMARAPPGAATPRPTNASRVEGAAEDLAKPPPRRAPHVPRFPVRRTRRFATRLCPHRTLALAP